MCYIVPIFGGWIADSLLGKYNTIYGSLLIYVIGTTLLPLVALRFDNLSLNNPSKYIYFAFALISIAVGTGGIKSNVAPFAAEQIQALGTGAVETFFNWFFWLICLGSLLAFTVVAWVQTKYGFFEGYLIPFAALLMALTLFVAARKKYVCSSPNGSKATDIFRIIYSAIKRKWRLQRQGCLLKYSEIGWLDYARTNYGGRYLDGQVNIVRSFCGLLPIFAATIMYWTLFFQVGRLL